VSSFPILAPIHDERREPGQAAAAMANHASARTTQLYDRIFFLLKPWRASITTKKMHLTER